MTLFVTDPACLLHDPNPGHPEGPERLDAVLRAMDHPDFAALHRVPGVRAVPDDILLAHSAAHLDHVLSQVPAGRALNFLDPDTVLCADTGTAAFAAAGCVLTAVDHVMKGPNRNAFCAVRPPGHHAHRDKAGGFCFFNNIAIGALAALERYPVDRVAIIDVDVHHGDGTQQIMWDRADVLFASMHQSPLYPFSGAAAETGAHDQIINVPLPAAANGATVRQALRDVIGPRVLDFKPQLIFVSAGFDGHRDDPIGGWALTADDYAAILGDVLHWARACCGGRLVAVLEGGYNTQALAASVTACLRVMMKEDDDHDT